MAGGYGLIVELRKQWREERYEAIAPLKAEIAELKGELDAVLALLGHKEFKSAGVIDPPRLEEAGCRITAALSTSLAAGRYSPSFIGSARSQELERSSATQRRC
jgi:hypothetical protein